MWLTHATVFVLMMCTVYAARDTANVKNSASKEFLHQLLEGMDTRIRPPSKDNGPVVVSVNFHVISFSSINEINMDFKTDIFFRESWTDPRLVYTEGPPSINLPSRFVDQIWTPDLYFPNEKEAKFHDVTMPNRLLKLFPNGTVIYSIRLTLTLSCPMELVSFPLDTQTCGIKIESYAYETHELQLVWRDPSVEIDDELELPQFELVQIQNVTCQKQYKTTGRFPCLKATFMLNRHFGFFLLQTYIPSALIIILSWVSFWINMDAVAARISLVSYPKAIDIWMSMGMLFVFAALLEYAFVNALSRKHAKEEHYKKTDNPQDVTEPNDHNNKQTGADFAENLQHKTTNKVNYREFARNLDKISRYLFPSIFLIFNVIYWPIYASNRV
ncbi:hypothetical protein LSH36_155g03008 [Paralvinella palmiformis]|uniref:Uncharacterized protein n=1 Tax=Paralvinella palmiformis TaxID=53620 RepID=A0AAD9N748_9ANNE|nr:hypothetical protein LSH36_155g03008 [Paralvinella palmiformis]